MHFVVKIGKLVVDGLSYKMIKEIIMPRLGQTIEEATIEKWHKKEGDKVAKGDVLLEIMTDKAVLEVESFHDGI